MNKFKMKIEMDGNTLFSGKSNSLNSLKDTLETLKIKIGSKK